MKITEATEEKKNIAIAELAGAEWVINRSIQGFPIRLLCFVEKYEPASWDSPTRYDDINELDHKYDHIHYSIPNYYESYDKILPLIRKQPIEIIDKMGNYLRHFPFNKQMVIHSKTQLCDALLVATEKFETAFFEL